MNKIYSSLSLILLLLTLGSCDSMFDNEIPPHDLVGDNAITSESSAKVALNGVYSYLRDGEHGVPITFVIMNSVQDC